MKEKMYYKTGATIFLIVAIGHLLRAVYNLEVVIGGVSVPIWFSWIAVILALYLSARGYQLSRYKS